MLAPIDVTNIRIETDRLILRAWRESDLNDFYAYASHPDVGIHAGWKPHTSVEESRTILDMFIREKKVFALELKETGRVVGSLGLEEMRPDPVEGAGYGREIGYVLGKKHWGRGLMPEAVRAVIDYCFRVLCFDYLTCGHFVQNDRSRRVIEKIGFEYCGESDFQTSLGTVERCKNYIMYNPRKMTAPLDVTGVTLETDRLILRPWQEGDLADYFAYTSDEAVAPGMGWTRVETMEIAGQIFPDYMSTKESLALELKETGRVIGDISIQPRPWERYPIDRMLRGREFGFGIRSEYWGRGLMPEAVRAVAAYCFHELGYDFITCGHFLGNDQSRRVIEKCGFTHLFDAAHTLPNGKTFDISTYIQYKEI